MNCLVTGGAGFIGSHVVDRLLRDGHQVAVLDNFSTGDPRNLEQHSGRPALRTVRIDAADLDGIRPHFAGVEWVFHLAALADIVPSIADPVEYYRSNVMGTMCVAEAARLAGVKRLLYAASSSCYGVPDSCPTAEGADIRPQYPYALTKSLGEQTALHWGRVYGLPTVSLRLFNVYGPRARTSGAYGAVFGVFLAQKLNGRPFTVVGAGEQTRDFVFVSDAVEAFVRAAGSDVAGRSYNVGSGRPQSINRLVELLGGEVVHVPKRPGEPDSTHADTGAIERDLGWRPAVSFEEGVGIMLDNISHWRTAPVWTPEKIEKATRDWFAHLGPEGKPCP